MSIKHWQSNDTEYENWVRENPQGFVANTHQEPNLKYFKIHRATHQLPDRSNPGSESPRTGNIYSKITAENFEELVKWVQERFPALDLTDDNFCKTCNPKADGSEDFLPKERSNTAKALAAKWNLPVEHALYRKTGDWYHQLERFPGALLDANGYVIFETEAAYRSCPELKIRQDVGCPEGISSIPGYTAVLVTDEVNLSTYERATYREGARRDVIQSRVERDRGARAACLAAFGATCSACGFNFRKVYGELGEGFIHVHHKKPVSQGEREVDPTTDLVPLCPNCHAMVHQENPPLEVAELRRLIHENA